MCDNIDEPGRCSPKNGQLWVLAVNTHSTWGMSCSPGKGDLVWTPVTASGLPSLTHSNGEINQAKKLKTAVLCEHMHSSDSTNELWGKSMMIYLQVQILKHSATSCSAMKWILSWRALLPLNKSFLGCEMAIIRLRVAFLLLPSATFLLLPWILSWNGEEDAGWKLEDEIKKNMANKCLCK